MMENYLTGLEDDLLDFCYEGIDTYDPPGFDEDFSHSPFGSNGDIDGESSDFENSFLNYSETLQSEQKGGRHSRAVGEGVAGSPKPVKKAQQRRAANMRERRRMKSINDAFDKLRTCFPSTVTTERRLSKVDTLRLAIQYIDHLGNLVRSCNDYGADKQLRKTPQHQEKVLMWCHLTSETDELFEDSWPEPVLVCHSLSWSIDNAPIISPGNRYTAPTWHPEVPTHSDMVNLTSFGNWEHRS